MSCHASVRNTFLVFEDITERRRRDSSAGCRAQSLDSGCSLLDDKKQDATYSHLGAILSGNLPGWRIGQSLRKVHSIGHEDQAFSAFSTPKAEEKSGLKAVLSSSSVSTMAPDDEDITTDLVEESAQESSMPVSPCTRRNSLGSKSSRQATRGFTQAGQQHTALVREFQHHRVPRTLDLAAHALDTAGNAPTTMMIRNIPNRYTQCELIRELEGLGFAGTFDFFYAPIDFGTMGNVGYAFVNFIDPTFASRCEEVMSGYVFKCHQQRGRAKVARVSAAHLQGLEANIRHYQKSAVAGRARSKGCGPIVMKTIASALIGSTRP